MFTSSRFRFLGLLCLALVVLAVPTYSMAKGGAAAVRMRAKISGIKAVAKYEERGARRKFNFQLELATPGEGGTVTAVGANGATAFMGSFVVNDLGRGIIDIDTTEGNVVADLNAGSVVTLSYKGQTYSGTLLVQ